MTVLQGASSTSTTYRGTGLGESHWEYVEVECSILPSGFIAPRVLIWKDGRRFEIERVVMCRRKDWDNTWYYEVQIRGQVKQLWYGHGAFLVLMQGGGTIHNNEPPELNAYELRKKYGYWC